MNIFGIPIKIDANCVEHIETQVRTHRRRRINKKWRKRYGVGVVKKPCAYMVNTAAFRDVYLEGKPLDKLLLVHPGIAVKLREEAEMNRLVEKFCSSANFTR